VDGPCHWSSKRRAIAGVACKFILRLGENEHKSRERVQRVRRASGMWGNARYRHQRVECDYYVWFFT
jgi:hypothetical protein